MAKGGKVAAEAAEGIVAKAAKAFLRTVDDVAKKGRQQAKRAARGLRDGLGKARDRARSFRGRTKTKDPIDVASGEVVLAQTDVGLPGILPLTVERTHISSWQAGRWFGPSWASTLDQRLEVSADGVAFSSSDGMVLIYPDPPVTGTAVLPAEGPRWPLRRTPDGYTLSDPQAGRFLHFPPARGGLFDRLPLSAITDRNGNRITFDYADNGTPRSVRHSGGYHIDIDTSDDRITALRLRDANEAPGGHLLMRYGYNEAGNLTEIINSSGRPLRFTYDDQHRMTGWIDRNGHEYHYTYDDQGRAIAGRGTGGYLDVTLTYSPDGRSTVVTDSLGNATTHHINDARQVVAETDPLGNTVHFNWDRYDRLLSRTDPLGNIIRLSYDSSGNLTTLTRPDGTEVVTDYNDLGQPVRTVDADGTTWRRDYDHRGNLISATDPLGATTTYTYGERGNLRSVRDPLGNTTRVQTDSAGLPTAITAPLGAVTRINRDSFGRVDAVTDPVGGITRYGWTIEGNLAWRTRPDGVAEKWSYDAESNLVEHIDPLGQPTRFDIGPFDQPTAKTSPDGARVEFSYDTELRLAAVTNPQGLVWRYHYDPAGNLVSESDFNGRVLTYAHDAAGQLVERTNGAGETTRYSRDPLGNIIERRAGNTITTFTYDRAGRMVRATNPDADLIFERDPLGRVLAETCNGRTVVSTYDRLGRRVSRRTPSGAESTWEYDSNSQPVALHTAGHSLHFGYDAAGREIERRIGTGTVLAQNWDANHRLLSQTLTAGGSISEQLASVRKARLVQRRSYEYRPDGYITSIDDHLSGTRRFDLDPTGRVTTVQGSGWTECYAYDPAGNITHATWPTASQPDTLGAAAQGEREYAGSLIRRAGDVRYEHDAQGRVTLRQRKRLSAKPRTWHYTWDADDRLVAVTTPDGQRWRYRYDPFGRRVAKQRLANDGASIAEQAYFTWDGVVLAEQAQVIQATDGRRATRVATWNYEPESFRPLCQIEHPPQPKPANVPQSDAPQQWIDKQFYAIVTDLVGTPTQLVTPDGRIAWHQISSLWNAPVRTSPAEVDCPLRFPGQTHDDETGLRHNLNRYYDPDTAAYVSADPLGLWQATNPHRYVKNPLVWIDPLGLAAYKVVRENDAGRFGDLDPGKPNDGFTPHHMPQAALGFTSRKEGGAIVMTQADHELTRNYGWKGRVTKAAEAGLPFRTVLDRDIQDLRRIGQVQHGDPSYFNPGITKLLDYYRSIGML